MLTILVIIIGDTILHIYSLTQLLLRFFSSWNTWLWKIITCCYQPEKWERDRLYATPENLCNVHKNQLKYETIVPLVVLKFLFSSDCCIFKPIPYAFPPLNCIRSANLQASARAMTSADESFISNAFLFQSILISTVLFRLRIRIKRAKKTTWQI